MELQTLATLLFPIQLQILLRPNFIFFYTVTDFGKAPSHSAYTVTDFGVISLFPYGVTNSGNHLCLPYIVIDYGTYHLILHTQLQTLAFLLYRVTNSGNPAFYSYRVTDSGIHFPTLCSYRLWHIFMLLPCRVTDSSKICPCPIELQTLTIISFCLV